MKQADKFACCVLGKALNGIPRPSVVGDGGNFQASSYSGPSLSRDRRIKMQMIKINKTSSQGVHKFEFNFFKSNKFELKN